MLCEKPAGEAQSSVLVLARVEESWFGCTQLRDILKISHRLWDGYGVEGSAILNLRGLTREWRGGITQEWDGLWIGPVIVGVTALRVGRGHFFDSVNLAAHID